MLKWLFAAALLLAPPALAQTCAPTVQVAEELYKQFQERKIAMGEMKAGGILVIYATKDGSTWTAIREMPGGVSCFLTSGEGWKVALIGRAA